MKRIICCILLLVIVHCNTGRASEIDFSMFSTEELIEMQKEINAELAGRNANLIYSGLYIGGESIKAGAYMLTLYESIQSEKSDYTFVILFPGGEYDLANIGMEYDLKENGEQCTVTINDGEALLIEGGTLFITPFSASWQP